MGYQRYAPRPELAPFVQCIWFYQGDASAAGMERTLPTGEMGLIVNLRADSMRVYEREDPRRYETRGRSQKRRTVAAAGSPTHSDTVGTC
ncbi:MAG: DUF6597 domain-containing transcriptional factor [Dehalococcoidia bacterium]